MTQMLVGDLDPRVVEGLKERARPNGRSLQKEVRAILEGAAEIYTVEEAREVSKRWRKRSVGQKFSDGAKPIREDRDA